MRLPANLIKHMIRSPFVSHLSIQKENKVITIYYHFPSVESSININMLGRSHLFFLEIMTYILSDNNEINSPTQIFANYHIKALHQDQDQTENVNEEVKLMTN